MEFPPSPAASDCDSLDGVDLDAYLALQGPLSGLPTPPMDRRSAIDCQMKAQKVEDSADRARVTAIFADRARDLTRTSYGTPSHVDYKLIEHIINLARWRTSREVCAVAFNILCDLRDQRQSTQHFSFNHSAAFLVMCAVQLASDFLEDMPMTNRRWNQEASSLHNVSCWSDDSMQSSKLDLLFAIDWRLHSLSTPRSIEQTLAVFLGEPDVWYDRGTTRM